MIATAHGRVVILGFLDFVAAERLDALDVFALVMFVRFAGLRIGIRVLDRLKTLGLFARVVLTMTVFVVAVFVRAVLVLCNGLSIVARRFDRRVFADFD
ncbi:MAG TPA: hypothetical protein VGM99_02270, partial [Candidatus Cybelea sp.]